MRAWWPWLLLLMPGGSLIALGVWLRRRWLAREAAAIDARIQPPIQLFKGQDDALRVRTKKRREAADGIRSRAAHVETGAPVSDVLRRVK